MRIWFFMLCVFLTGSAFAQGKPDWMQYKNPYVADSLKLDTAHRAPEEVITWAQASVSDVLSFAPDDYRQRLSSFQKYFALSGWQAYTAALQQFNLLALATNDGYAVRSIVEAAPEILNEGPIDGVYRWAVRMPVIVSLSRAGSPPRLLGRYTLSLGLARGAEGKDIVIDNWQMAAR